MNNIDENADFDVKSEHKETLNWDELPISMSLLRGIYAYGFEKPSPIQSKACLPIIECKDIIAQAQSGTGKTAAFSIGVLSKIDVIRQTTQAIIVSHTHELAEQTAKVVENLGSMINGLRVQILIGGTSVETSKQLLKYSTPHIIVGTPGRICAMIEKGLVTTREVQIVVLDEADELLSNGFSEQIYTIFESLRQSVQIALFSATLPPYIYDIANKFMKTPTQICVKNEDLKLDGITQYYVTIADDHQKYDEINKLYSKITTKQSIIYCNSVLRVIDLTSAMKMDDFPVCSMHSDMDKDERKQEFDEFRNGTKRMLISTNLTARGIDIQQVGLVVNFDLPKDIAVYLHRIGRSGRWGRKGIAINFVTSRDLPKLREISDFYKCEILPLPEFFADI